MEVIIGVCGAVIPLLILILVIVSRDLVRAERLVRIRDEERDNYLERIREAGRAESNYKREHANLTLVISRLHRDIAEYEKRLESICGLAQTKRNEEWQQEMESDINDIIEAANNLDERWKAES